MNLSSLNNVLMLDPAEGNITWIVRVLIGGTWHHLDFPTNPVAAAYDYFDDHFGMWADEPEGNEGEMMAELIGVQGSNYVITDIKYSSDSNTDFIKDFTAKQCA